MISIVSHAEPAELVSALRASHMHASLILFDRTLALWTRLRVQLHPVVRIVVSRANPVSPGLQQIAINGHVSVFGTSKAE